MKKILIASGCSFTEKNFKSIVHPEMDCTWDKWPELLAQKLDMDCINLGSRGAGNEYIYNSIVQRLLKIKKNRIGLVMAGWSTAKRFNFIVTKNSMGEHVHGRMPDRYIHIDDFPNRDFSMSKLYPSVVSDYPNADKLDHYEYIINRSIGRYFDLQMFCENFEIPLKQFQMLDLFVDMRLGNFKSATIMMRSPYLDHIDVKSFMGWPISSALGGFNLWGKILNQELKNVKSKHNKLNEDDPDGDFDPLFRGSVKQNTQISNQDPHPNALTQQQMADFLYEKIKD